VSGLTNDLLLDGMKWSINITEYPEVNATEEWTVINLTGDVHPIHLHLVQFQEVRKQEIDVVSC
jgi:FtsP/CotA-like multicopper oxidase with cupredoxin domain